mmetsp:Transcript_53376/g.47993  ORF Transcript_53376/g.47993 Transcript_53376/m.47993 type:complete len:309 (+) Transcript_53376:1-927(+)
MANQPKPDRKSQPWTQQEKQRLIALKDAEKTNYDIAVELKRTKGGVIEQWKKICAQYREYQKQTPTTNNHIQNVSELEDDRDDHKEDECFQDIDNACDQTGSFAVSKKADLSTVDTLNMSMWFYRLLKYLELEPNSGDNIRRVQHILRGLRTCSRCDQVLTNELVQEFQALSDKYAAKYGVWREDAQGVYLLHKEDRNINTDRNRNLSRSDNNNNRDNDDRKYSESKPVIDNKYGSRYAGDVSIDYYRKLKEYFRQQNMGDEYMKIDTMMEIMMNFKDQYGRISVDDNGYFQVQKKNNDKNRNAIVIE